MIGSAIERLRDRLGLSRAELADVLNSALDKKYTPESVRRWERDADRAPAKAVQAFLDELAVSGDLERGVDGEPGLGALDGDDAALAGSDGFADTAPGRPGLGGQPALTSGRGAWTKACEELWEMVATGVGMMGAATGNQALVTDGAIILADKEALGAAWGKLAETNETFRRMLVGMTEGGAWLQVALVTGTTVSKCWQSHAYYAAVAAQQATPAEEPSGDEFATAA
jgi:transcriptional regulator with XRE-family HTH domain